VTSGAWEERETTLSGARTIASASGQRLATVVYDQLKDRLLDGAYAAGQRLQVEGLRNEFGVSKQPIMEAMRRLASDGLVEIIPQVGCRVPVYGPTDVIDFFAIFGGMEGALASVAAHRHTDAQLSQLVRVNAEIDVLSAEADAQARAHGYRMLNRRFHGLVHDMAHSPVVAQISRRMWDMSDLLINTSGIPQPLASAIDGRHDDHERIIAALRRRDAGQARAEMEKHIVDTVAIIHLEAQVAHRPQ
jgi:DNA-binding GntR family transcriptional regulator